MIRPQPLDDHDALLHAVESAGVDDDASFVVADADAVAVADPERSKGLRVDERGGPSLAGDAGRRIVEARIQKRARRRRHESEWPLRVAIVDNREMIRKRRHARMLRSENGPVRAEMEFPIGVGKPVEKMPGLEAGPAIEPD